MQSCRVSDYKLHKRILFPTTVTVKIYGDMDQSTRSICKNIGVEPTRRGTTRSVVRRVARRQYFAYTLSALMHGIRIFALSCDLFHFHLI